MKPNLQENNFSSERGATFLGTAIGLALIAALGAVGYSYVVETNNQVMACHNAGLPTVYHAVENMLHLQGIANQIGMYYWDHVPSWYKLLAQLKCMGN